MGPEKEIIGIMAATSEGVIGNGGKLPWCYPEERDHFRKTTQGHALVMGRRTFETLPLDVLKDREVAVFSKQGGVKRNKTPLILQSLEDFLSLPWGRRKIFMIGGAEIAHMFLKAGLVSEFLLTKIHTPYSGDTYLDLKLFEGWNEEIIATNAAYTLIKLRNPERKIL